ncbi:MAG: class B sortase [Lachnospiraceae bacterium]|nr:class B sortase [Lachnospiraceae bacterium]
MKKQVWHIVAILGLIGLIACLGFVAWNLMNDMKAKNAYEDTASRVQATPTPTSESADDSSLTVEELDAMEFTGVREGKESKLPPDIFSGKGNPINFDELTAINSDLYAWIRIQGADVDYPIAQHPTDELYYLNHDLYQDVSSAGCVFTQHYNKKDFSDPVTVIYGHNMADGVSMFASLHWYEDADFFKKNRYCYIYTADKIRVYDIISTRSYSNDNLMTTRNFKDTNVYSDFIKEMMATRDMESNLREGVEVSVSDRLIVLSTCINGWPENRYLITGKLVWEGTEAELERAEALIAEQHESDDNSLAE